MKPALYLLSGLLCDQTVWQAQINALKDIRDVRAVDFQGFDDLTVMAESVLDQAPDVFALVGHSMGARVALEILRLAPQRVERLALFDTGTHPVKTGEKEARQKLIDLAREQGMGALAEQWLPPMMSPANALNASLMEPLKSMVRSMSVETFEGQVRALLNRPDASLQLSSIQCPTLIGVGREDTWSNPAQHESMAGNIDNSRLVIFERSGHMAPYEAPVAVNASMRDWLTTTA
ncbi:alpha/beta fold hydrolase [Pseudomonas sp. FP2300]|uniref:alpha/beta fold hydrolase n=1 Tax=Pseudomonas sp. FP2300 TaxID=2954090 RepID=UPI0027346128|nr:alpha/beta hydrolase [Pseudomonas sp. FP2300]WLH65149.1 alpha/beta hydrolase [Pseudomonas sp. FP2300]